jgi:hypothetical protein
MLPLEAATGLNCEDSLHTIGSSSGFVPLKVILSTLSPSTVPDWTTHWFLADVSALGEVARAFALCTCSVEDSRFPVGKLGTLGSKRVNATSSKNLCRTTSDEEAWDGSSRHWKVRYTVTRGQRGSLRARLRDRLVRLKQPPE